MRLHRPVLAGLALGALLPVTAAEAATGVTAAGSALSSATLVEVSIGALADLVEAQSVSVGSLSATAQTVTSAAPSVTFVPITLNGVETGAVTVTPANSPQTVGAVSTSALPTDAVSATSPAATLTASKNTAGPQSSLTTSLGSASILGLPITLDGGLDVGSATDSSHSQAGKVLTISGVSLPSLADLLAALGIDLAKLPVPTLNALVSQLPVSLDAATQTAIDAANSAIDTAAQNVADAEQAVTDATADLAAAAAAFDSALSSANLGAAVLPSGVSAPLDHQDWDTMSGTPDGQAAQAIILAANPGLSDTAQDYEDAKVALAAADSAVAPLQAVLDTAAGVLAGIVAGVLDDTALASVGAAEVSTKAAVGTAKTATVTGFVEGVEVMGQDVLAAVTGDSKVDAAALVGDVADDVNAALATLGATLSNILSGVTGATGLVVPAPSIEVLTKTTETGVDGAYGTATATVTALSISLGSVTIPAIYALDDAGDLPGIGAITDGFSTAPLSVNVGVLSETARFRPATIPAGPTLPATGVPSGLAIVAVIGTAFAVGARRRLRAEG